MVNNSDNTILVTGITGQQGGAVARHLLAKGWHVRGLSRDLSKPAVKVLQNAGAEVAQGDFDDRASLDAALNGVYGVFSVQNNWLPGVGVAGEVRQGKALADAAKAADVRHFVYTSVGGAERQTGIPHFESKWQIEQYVRFLDLPATILRPVAFIENFNWSRSQILNGHFPSAGLRPDKGMQRIAVEDIGAFAALAFENPPAYLGQALEIAGDESTEAQIAEIFSRVIGRPVQIGQMTFGEGQQPDPEAIKMFQWFNDKGYAADIPALRKQYPALMNFETWLRNTGWENAEPEPPSAGTWGNG